MDQLRYEFNPPQRSSLARIYNMFAGWRDRRGVLRQFEIDNNIDRKDSLMMVVTRKKYYIRTHHIEYLSDLRDRVVHREVMKLDRKQKDVLRELDNLKNVRNEQYNALLIFKNELKEIKSNLTKSKISSLEKAHLQGSQGTTESSIENQNKLVSRTDSTIEALSSIYRDNHKAFGKFQKEVDSEFEIALNEYIQRAGRMVHGIGFTNYDAQLRDVSDHIKKLVEEMKSGV